MDPFSLTVGALSIVGVSVGTCAKLLRDIRSKYKNASLTIASMATECVTIQAALCQIESLTEKDPELYISRLEVRPDLKSALDTAITGCTTTFAVLEDELSKLADDSTRKGKFQYLWNESTMRELLSQIRSQYSAINFLVMAIQSESIAKCTDLIRDTVPVLEQIARQTKDLRQTRPRTRQVVAESIFSGSSSGSKLSLMTSTVDSLEFSFDSQVINSKAYRRALADAKRRIESDSAVENLAAIKTPLPATKMPFELENEKEISTELHPSSPIGDDSSPKSEQDVVAKVMEPLKDCAPENNQDFTSTRALLHPEPLSKVQSERLVRGISHLGIAQNVSANASHISESSDSDLGAVEDSRLPVNARLQETVNPRESTETYASTVSSTEDDSQTEEQGNTWTTAPGKAEAAQLTRLGVIEDQNNVLLRASTPQDFGDFFPSVKRLQIRHDNTTVDGNMNLRIEIEEVGGPARKKALIQLFHLRMYDLKEREFSLRRYCRDSGREVCHYVRKHIKSKAPRPTSGLQSTVSGMVEGFRRRASSSAASLRWRSTSSRASAASSKGSTSSKRNSRHNSISSRGGDDESDQDYSAWDDRTANVTITTNTIRIEFSNYAHVDLKRRGSTSTKRYEFEYWGQKYTWKRIIEKGDRALDSYHLFQGDSTTVIAHIVPELLSPSQIRMEKEAGGWIQPCSMWICDQKVIDSVTDIPDVIVATGLAALVDDCIKRNFKGKISRKPLADLTLRSPKYEMEYVGPRALVENIFKRRSSGPVASGQKRRASRT